MMALCVVVLCTAIAEAQDWLQVSTTGPPARYYTAMAYDSARGVTVLFGGEDFSQPGSPRELYRDTWEWNGTTWTQVSNTGPSARYGHAMAYDSARGVTVLFGGRDADSNKLGDTWEWNGTTWTQVSSIGPQDPPFFLTPQDRYFHAMAYDEAHGVVVLNAGDAFGRVDDTWGWNGVYWDLLDDPDTGDGWQNHTMAYDSARGRVVRFGGFCGYDVHNGTYEWDGNSWTLMDPGTRPAERWEHAMAYFGSLQYTVIQGGNNDEGLDVFNDTWAWDGTNWTQANVSSPGYRWGHSMAYDSKRQRIVLFGGYNYPNDTWEFGFFPDLKITFDKIKPKNAHIGGKLKLIAFVTNNGPGKSSPTTVNFYLSTDKTLDGNDTLLGSKNIKGLKKNKSKKAKLKFTLPASTPTGRFWIIVEITTGDTNTNNNTAVSSSRVKITN